MSTPLDIPSLLARCMGDYALARTLIDAFSAQATSEVAAIKASIQANDSALTARIAHSLKGSSGSVSAIGVQRAAALLESCARAGDTRGVLAHLTALEHEVAHFIAAIPTAHDQLTPGMSGTHEHTRR